MRKKPLSRCQQPMRDESGSADHGASGDTASVQIPRKSDDGFSWKWGWSSTYAGQRVLLHTERKGEYSCRRLGSKGNINETSIL